MKDKQKTEDSFEETNITERKAESKRKIKKQNKSGSEPTIKQAIERGEASG